MRKIKIIVVANKFKQYQSCIEHFEKLLQKDVQIIKIKPSNKSFPTNIEQETQAILQILQKHKDRHKILLAIEGELIDSQQLASTLKSQNKVIFVIGGAWGVDNKQLDKHINQKISLGKITLNHILALVVLLEQIFRSFDINKWGSYHH